MCWADWIMFLSDPGTILGLGTKKHGQNEALSGGAGPWWPLTH